MKTNLSLTSTSSPLNSPIEITAGELGSIPEGGKSEKTYILEASIIPQNGKYKKIAQYKMVPAGSVLVGSNTPSFLCRALAGDGAIVTEDSIAPAIDDLRRADSDLSSRIDINTTSISNHTTSISSLNTLTSNHTNSITDLSGFASRHEASINSHTTRIGDLDTKVAGNASNIQALFSAIPKSEWIGTSCILDIANPSHEGLYYMQPIRTSYRTCKPLSIDLSTNNGSTYSPLLATSANCFSAIVSITSYSTRVTLGFIQFYGSTAHYTFIEDSDFNRLRVASENGFILYKLAHGARDFPSSRP